MNVCLQILLDLGIGLLGGVISGLIASYVLEGIRKPPKIYICPQIAKYPDGRYRIKIINESEQDAFDISYYIRLVDPRTDIRFVIMGSTIPILRNSKFEEPKEIENVSSIYPLLINKKRMDMLSKEEYIRVQYENGKISVTDFCKNENDKLIPQIDVVITAKNVKSGRPMTFVQPLTEIVNAEWEVGKKVLTVQSKSRPDA